MSNIDFTKTDLGGGATMLANGSMVVSSELDGETLHYPAYRIVVGPSFDGADTDYEVHLDGLDRVRIYPVKSIDDVKVDEAASEITFQAQGTIYTVRAFTDSDGQWASMTGAAEVPAQALEEIFMNDVARDADPTIDSYPDESLFALADDTGAVKYLMYAGGAEMYTRTGGKWEVLDDPTGEMLDGLEILDVDPTFINVYDSKSEGLTKGDVAAYAPMDETPMAASAFKFAPAPKKG